ncbi:MAG: cytochrome c3 family protein [Anaerolineales bacterium]|nr:cytochrome c3 family protein [Anaerolineales bacterium]
MERLQRTYRHLFGVIGVAVIVVGLLGLFLLSPLQALAGPADLELMGGTAVLQQVDESNPLAADLACTLCHSDSDQEIEFPSGETLSVMIDLGVLATSVHGSGAENPLICTDCHQTVNDYSFPHTPSGAENLRDYQVERAATCERCHQQPHITSHSGIEAASPVTCTDCHGSHHVQTVDTWQAGDLTDTCVNCHAASGVDLTDPDRLTPLIRSGLFTDEVDNDYCLSCHSQPDFTLTFPNGDTKSLTVDADAFHNSVHGVNNPWNPLNCTDCHQNYTFPHEPVTSQSLREYNLDRYTLCIRCHEQQYEKTLDSTHGVALEAGNWDAAVCTDCHGNHDTPPPDEPRQRISHTCQKCHSEIFDEYAESIHGTALLEESNPDVPTCIDCHGVHNINDPTTALFRVRSPELCANCHADDELMAKYDISTDVFDTYVADFHGTTVTLFEHQDPNVETNKAVCYDCHGVHNIKAPDDPDAGIKANLLVTCQQCHPNASENFPDSWTSHFKPSLEHNPLVYLINLFYQIVIPTTVVFLSFLVLTDVYRKIRMRFGAK